MRGPLVGPLAERSRRRFYREDRALNETLSDAAPSLAIGQAERDRRAYAVDFGVGSTRFEGGILTPEAHAINAQFVAGDLTQTEWIDAMLMSGTVRTGK